MKEIRLSPAMQLLGILALGGAVVAGVVAQLPEIQRYLKVKSM
jgi:hypothetical protein